MLVVTCRPGDAIVIERPTGELIEAVVLSVKGNQVRLGTDAPKHLPVVRKELKSFLEFARTGFLQYLLEFRYWVVTVVFLVLTLPPLPLIRSAKISFPLPALL